MNKFQLADEEFQPLLKQMFEQNALEGRINVEPERIIVLRSNARSKTKIAYIKPIKGEYALLTEKKYFMVIVSDNFDRLDNDEQKWTILHEYCHCRLDADGEYVTVDHNIKDFTYLLKDATHNIDLVDDYKFVNKNNEKATPKIPALE